MYYLTIVKNENRIINIIEAAESLLQTSITIHDRSGIFRGSHGEYLLNRTRGIHRHPCCRLIHDHRCLAECSDRVEVESVARDRAFSHVCWKGMREVVVPVKREGGLLFTLFAGGYRSRQGFKKLPDPRLDRSWQERYRNLPVMDAVREREMGLVLERLGAGLVDVIEEMHLPSGADRGRASDIRRFLHYNAHRKVTMTDLARSLHLSRFRTSHLVTELFGMPFRKLLLKERLERGRALLLAAPDHSVAAVAAQIGIGDEYHFNREFKKKFGLPPGKYRKQSTAP